GSTRRCRPGPECPALPPTSTDPSPRPSRAHSAGWAGVRVSFHDWPNPMGSHSDRRPTVLVVDDTEGVRQMLAVVLRQFGFAVLLAAGGRQAVEVYRRHRRDIDLVLMDVQMPDP